MNNINHSKTYKNCQPNFHKTMGKLLPMGTVPALLRNTSKDEECAMVWAPFQRAIDLNH